MSTKNDNYKNYVERGYQQIVNDIPFHTNLQLRNFILI